MLHLIIGPAGSGKTTLLYQKIENWVDAGNRAILLVPEQYSFESEKALYRRLGAKRAAKVEVLSFTRLCDRIFREYGGLAVNTLPDTGKMMLMSLALWEVRDTLQLYARQVGSAAFVESLCEAVSEWKNAGISPEELSQAAWQTGDMQLRDKAAELSTVYGAYNALLENRYSDGSEDMQRACRLLEEHPFFQEYGVFVDSFMTFLAPEFHLLEFAIAQSPACWGAFCSDSLGDTEHGTGVFSPAKKAIQRWIRFAHQSGTPVAAPQILHGSHRFASEELRYLEESFLRPRVVLYPNPCQMVEMAAAQGPWEEIQWVAQKIAALVREEGYRYREIAVICRSLDRYRTPIDRIFSRYEIPCFFDRRVELESKPLPALILSALEAVRGKFSTEEILRFAKNPAMGLDVEELAQLENYCFTWSVEGKHWLEPFANHPDGLSETFDEQDALRLESLNHLRLAIIQPLQRLKKRLEAGDGVSFASGIFSLLEEIDAPGHFREFSDTLPPQEKALFLEEQSGLWDALMEILDLFAQIVGEHSMSLTRLMDLFKLAIEKTDIGQRPQTLDQVIVGMADRIRPGEPKATFVIGAVEGEFPATVTTGGVFTDLERTRLLEAGVELSQNEEEKGIYEKFYAYFAVTTPSHRLYLSYPREDGKGGSLAPSVILSQAAKILGGKMKPVDMDPVEASANLASAREAFSWEYQRDSAQRKALETYLQGKDPDLLTRMAGAGDLDRFSIDDPQLAKKLFGKRMRLSPSRVERYFSCPFGYFCASGLHIHPRRKVEFSPLESGSVIHFLLERMVSRYGGKGLAQRSEEELQREVEELLREYLSQRIDQMDALPTRFHYLFRRLVALVVRLLRQLGAEFSQSDFEPAAFELSIGKEIKPVELQTADGISVTVEGVVDRVDVLEQDGKKYVRVIDYKSGSKTFNLSDIFYGLNMQMLIYLFSICENGEGKLADALPAGVLYLPAKNVIVNTQRGESEEEVASQQQKKRRMNGLILEDKDVVLGMERDGKGVFIPAKVKANGELDARSSLASLEEMGKLRTKIQEHLLQMAQELSSGRVEALPVSGLGYDPCTYCEYRSVCGFEEGDRVRTLAEVDKEIFWKEGGEEDGRA